VGADRTSKSKLRLLVVVAGRVVGGVLADEGHHQ
jgi:hypothetical protein